MSSLDVGNCLMEQKRELKEVVSPLKGVVLFFFLLFNDVVMLYNTFFNKSNLIIIIHV